MKGENMAYAENTSVPVDRSKAEIEKTLMHYGAECFAYMTMNNQAVVAFKMEGRNIRFTIPFPVKNDFNQTNTGRKRKSSVIDTAYEQEIRRRWRALSLVIKAKMEAVESGISIFEDEFLANIVTPNGKTVSEQTRPLIAQAYATGGNVKLLPE
jgi:hypothetical protein